MKIEIKRAKSRDLLVVVTFEKDTNYDPEKHEWVPRLEEVSLINQTLKRITKQPE